MMAGGNLLTCCCGGGSGDGWLDWGGVDHSIQLFSVNAADNAGGGCYCGDTASGQGTPTTIVYNAAIRRVCPPTNPACTVYEGGIYKPCNRALIAYNLIINYRAHTPVSYIVSSEVHGYVGRACYTGTDPNPCAEASGPNFYNPFTGSYQVPWDGAKAYVINQTGCTDVTVPFSGGGEVLVAIPDRPSGGYVSVGLGSLTANAHYNHARSEITITARIKGA